MRKFIEDILFFRRPLLHAILFPLLACFALPFSVASRIRLFLFCRGILRSRELPCIVISVGNITVGGSGKTPFTIYLAEKLKKHFAHVVVVSRGYRGSPRNKAMVVSDGKEVLLNVETAGDEPFLIAQRLFGIPVLCGKDRYASGHYAVENLNAQVVILDDGFQHLQLKHDLDIVLIDGEAGFGNRWTLPAGILREPLGGIKRGDIFVIKKTRANADYSFLEREILKHTKAPHIFYADVRGGQIIDERGKRKDIEEFSGKRFCAVSGIVNHQGFLDSLLHAGLVVSSHKGFSDHHIYQMTDISKVNEIAKSADAIITTEKDLYKLIQYKDLLEKDLYALPIELTFDREEELLARIFTHAALLQKLDCKP
ncbi:MAG: tetraacyldisaccharide 4'-kinase [Thermodesulfobacteriota bacterium]|nr:tetraacyldisaccharide 4'-kinase [Thermodesulfobacteriota bacterium]